MTDPASDAVESTPLFDQTTAALSTTPSTDTSTPVDTTAPVDPAPADPAMDPAAPAALDLPAGPDLAALQAFTEAIPDEGHRAIAQQLVDAFTVRDAQLTAFIAAYTTAQNNITTLQGDVAALQGAVAGLQAQVVALTAAPPAPTP